MKNKFITEDFIIPEILELGNYRLEILSPKVAEIDYEAVMSSKKKLRTVFAKSTEWPKDDMTLSENIMDLERHEREFYSREAFAYTVLDPSGEKCIGCIYIEPCFSEEYDCEVYFWVRDSEKHLDEEIYRNTRIWIEEVWPFKKIVFPGREIPWDMWNLNRFRDVNKT